MKKSVILSLLIISILLVSVISVSLVSAESLGDIWSKITGRAVENETEVTNETEIEPEPEPEQCPTIIGWRISDNICISESGCEYDSSSYTYYGSEEECVSQLGEEEEESGLESESPPSTEDSDSTDSETCAAEIKVTFDKKVYYIGDIAEIVIEVLDSQGNHLPNYVFNNQMYDGIWHTPGSERTDSEGYFRAQPTVQKEQSTIGMIKFKVYTNEYSNCNSVEDFVDIEIRERGEGSVPVPCGIGTCIPEEEEGPKEIPEDKMLYKCNGCELGDKCYPMGYRKQGEYCSENYEFISQIGGKCENSFESKSNLCISGECVEEGLMRKIIKWFKRLFGGGDGDEEPGDEICRKLLIEENIGDYEYFASEYGKREEQQVALYSEDGEQIDIVKCCMAGYLEDGEAKGTAGVVCPFDNKKDVETSLYWLLNKGEITLGEYKGQEIYKAGNAIVWTYKNFIVASGTDPKATTPLPEKVINAYLDKYPNDL